MADELIHPWPMPDTIGLSLDPAERAKVRSVRSDSHAAKAGFAVGDEIVSVAGQPILSIADVQWVLHNAPSPARLKAEVLRAEGKRSLAIDLPARWRVASDITWRTSTWDLRRMAFGGLVLRRIQTGAPRTFL
jgi:C-terminal processing protease CtpA/Prc